MHSHRGQGGRGRGTYTRLSPETHGSGVEANLKDGHASGSEEPTPMVDMQRGRRSYEGNPPPAKAGPGAPGFNNSSAANPKRTKSFMQRIDQWADDATAHTQKVVQAQREKKEREKRDMKERKAVRTSKLKVASSFHEQEFPVTKKKSERISLPDPPMPDFEIGDVTRNSSGAGMEETPPKSTEEKRPPVAEAEVVLSTPREGSSQSSRPTPPSNNLTMSPAPLTVPGMPDKRRQNGAAYKVNTFGGEGEDDGGEAEYRWGAPNGARSPSNDSSYTIPGQVDGPASPPRATDNELAGADDTKSYSGILKKPQDAQIFGSSERDSGRITSTPPVRASRVGADASQQKLQLDPLNKKKVYIVGKALSPSPSDDDELQDGDDGAHSPRSLSQPGSERGMSRLIRTQLPLADSQRGVGGRISSRMKPSNLSVNAWQGITELMGDAHDSILLAGQSVRHSAELLITKKPTLRSVHNRVKVVNTFNIKSSTFIGMQAAAPAGIMLTASKKELRQQARERGDRKHVRFREPKKFKLVSSFFRLSILNPQEDRNDDLVVSRWSSLMVIPLSYEVWVYPYRLALGYPGFNAVFLMDIVVDSVFVLDALVSLNTVLVIHDQGHEKVLKTRSAIFDNYVTHKLPYEWFPCMLMYIPVLIVMGHGTATSMLHWLWWTISVPRVYIRGKRLVTYFRAMEMRLDVNVYHLQLYKFTLMIFLTSHWVGCIFFFLSRLVDHSTDTWIKQFQSTIPSYRDYSEPKYHYLVLLYKGFNQMTNMGYVGTFPNTASEMAWSVVVMFAQIVLAAYILGTLFNYLVQKDLVVEEHKRRMREVSHFMETRKLPEDLREEMHRHFEFQFRKAMENKASAQVTLTKSLQIKVAACQYGHVIEKCSFRGGLFSGCNQQFVNAVIVKLHENYLMPCEEFITKGDMARELSFVLEGFVQEMDGDTVLRTIRGDIPQTPSTVGEVAFFIGITQPRTVRARADGDVKLLSMHKYEYEEIIQSYPEQHDLITSNLLMTYHLNKNGDQLEHNMGDKVAEDEQDQQFVETKAAIQESLKRRIADDFSRMFFAVKAGDVEELSSTLRQGLDPNMRNYDGRTTLHLAAKRGMFKVAEILLQNGADKNAVDRWGHTPLQEAINHQQGPVIGLLVEWRANLNVANAGSALCEAASKADLEYLKRLLENGVNPNIGDCDRRTALHIAAAEGQQKVVELLLNSGANVNCTDRWGSTPIMDAINSRHRLTTRIIHAAGGTMPEEAGADRICQAASDGDVPMLSLLSDCQMDLSKGDYDQRCPLHLAAAAGHLLAVNFLLSVSPDPNVKDRWGGTPIDDALKGETLYHMYCAKAIQAAGGVPGTPCTYERGEELFRRLEDISMKEVRERIAYLIHKGFHNHKPKSDIQGTQVLHRTLCMRIVAEGCELLERTQAASAYIDENLESFRKHNETMIDDVEDLANALSKLISSVKNGDSEGRQKWSIEDRVWQKSAAELKVDAMIESCMGVLREQLEDPVEDWRRPEDIIRDLRMVRESRMMGVEGERKLTATISLIHTETETYLYDAVEQADQINNQGTTPQVNLAARAFQKQVMHTHAVEHAVRYVQAAFRQTKVQTGALQEAGSTGSKHFARSKSGQDVGSLTSSLSLNNHRDSGKMFMTMKDLPTMLNILGIQASHWEIETMILDSMSHSVTIQSEHIAEVQVTAESLIASSQTFRNLFLKHPGGHGTPPPVLIVKRGISLVHDVWHLLLVNDKAAGGRARGNQLSCASLLKFRSQLGEVGKEIFSKLFQRVLDQYEVERKHSVLANNSAVMKMLSGPTNNNTEFKERQLTIIDYWNCWLAFITDKSMVFAEHDEEDARMSRLTAGLSDLQDKLRQQSQRRSWHNLFRGGKRSKSMKALFFRSNVIPAYESVYLRLTNDLTSPLMADQYVMFLEMMFPEHTAEYKVSEKNIQEFLQEFRNPNAAYLMWGDIRKVIREQNAKSLQNSKYEPLLLGNVLNPASRPLSIFQTVLKLSSSWAVISIPFVVAFQPYDDPLSFASILGQYSHDLLCWCNMVLKFNTAFVNRHSVLMMDRRRVMRHYLSSDFLLDLSAAFPIDILSLLLGGSLRVASWLRVPKLVHAFVLVLSMNSALKASSTVMTVNRLMFSMVILLHYLACIWFELGTSGEESWYTYNSSTLPISQFPEGLPNCTNWNLPLESYPDEATMEDYTIDLRGITPDTAPKHRIAQEACFALTLSKGRYGLEEDASLLSKYLLSFYWVTATMSTNGVISNLYPRTYSEVIFTTSILCINLTLVAYILGEISNIVMTADGKIVAMREELGAVESFIQSKKLPPELMEEVRAHFHAQGARGESINMTWLFSVLSYGLQVKLAAQLSREFLDQVALFKKCGENFMDSLSVLLVETQYGPEDYVFCSNEVSREMHFVVRGTLELLTVTEEGEEELEQYLTPGESVGDLSFFFGMRHLNTVRVSASSSCTVFTLKKNSFTQLLKMYPEEEKTIAENALMEFDRARTKSFAAVQEVDDSGKSTTSARTQMSEIMENIENSKVGDAIYELKDRRKQDRIMKFFAATALGNMNSINKMLDAGDIVINVRDDNARTALHVAASVGNYKAAEILLARGADPNLVDSYKNTPLNDAVRHGHDSLAELLQREHPGLCLVMTPTDIAVQMCEAAAAGKVDVLERLVRNGADVTQGDYDMRTALHLAASEGQKEAVQYLLGMGADVNAKDRFQGTPLDDAIRHDHLSVQPLLVEAGAELTAMDMACKMCEAATSGDVKMLTILMRCGVNPNSADYDLRTPLHLAASNGKIRVMDLLLNATPPADANPMDRLGNTPLDDAIRHEQHVAISLLEIKGGILGKEAKKTFAKEAVPPYKTYALKPEQLMQISADLELTKEHQSLKALQTIQSGVIDIFPQLTNEVTKLLELLQSTQASLHTLAKINNGQQVNRSTRSMFHEMSSLVNTVTFVEAGKQSSSNLQLIQAKSLLLKSRLADMMKILQDCKISFEDARVKLSRPQFKIKIESLKKQLRVTHDVVETLASACVAMFNKESDKEGSIVSYSSQTDPFSVVK